MKENELMMSDVPWAVAWYGQRQCVWLTLNAQDDFFAINDYMKPVQALYLTPETMDGKFVSDWVRGGEHSWGSFVRSGVLQNQIPPGFPLRNRADRLSARTPVPDRPGTLENCTDRIYAAARRNRSAMPDHSGKSGGASTTINSAPASSQRCNSA